VVEASDAIPCLALALKLDMALVREFLSREEFPIADARPANSALCTGETTAEFLNACCRLVDLLDTPEDIPFLSGFIEREIIYRILRGAEGVRLRAIATIGDQSQRTATRPLPGSRPIMRNRFAWKNWLGWRAWPSRRSIIISVP
jgi:AraC-type transcriptional regulator N-terminus